MSEASLLPQQLHTILTLKQRKKYCVVFGRREKKYFKENLFIFERNEIRPQKQIINKTFIILSMEQGVKEEGDETEDPVPAGEVYKGF